MTSPSKTAPSSPGDATAQAPQKRAVSIHDILAELRSSALNERDKGDKFERLMAAFVRTDPLYAQRYSDVWLWSDWPDRGGKADTGVDLVAKERETGELCAIQCKFFSPTHTLQKEDIDSFFTASGKAAFASRMVISTTDKWSKHAEDALEGQQVPVARLRVRDLDDSSIDWSQFSLAEPEQLKPRAHRQLRPHQQTGLDHVVAGFATQNRGKLIMACGTGKTFTSLKIAEMLVPAGGSVLFLAPSISLVSQSLKEWSREASVPLRTYAVCSDIKVGKRTKSEDIGAYDLAYPATTNAKKLYAQVSTSAREGERTVIFSTYQSLKVIADAQALGMAPFDLVICDEAHRTTGVTLADDDESAFVRVHDPDFIHADKRLYMTATPRIYDDSSKSKAQEANAVLCSMDDEAQFGPEFHRLGFGEAVGKGLLTDYKVLVLAVDEEHVSKVFQAQLADKNSELNLEDAAKIVGCWNGLAKRGVSGETLAEDPHPMRRAVAFARSIRDSQRIADLFTGIVNQYAATESDSPILSCSVQHVDGTFNALVRNERLDWLRAEMPFDGKTCRILSNARCLSEGVDIPDLDAVLFLNPRNSVVDVVQSVGRVMRISPGKEYGYIILPIAVPASMTPEEALRDNKRYRVVWDVLQALRAHDDRFNAMVNKIELNRDRDDQLQIIGVGGGLNEDGSSSQTTLHFPQISEWRDAIYAKIVQKVGDRRYWEQWAQDVAAIAERNTARIRAMLSDESATVYATFTEFVAGLRNTLNDSITTDDAINMLSQHLITRPVFDALFADYSFAENNPVSVAMQAMVDALDEQNIDKETASLAKFYESVRLRADGIDNAAGKQQIIADLYEKFFKTAFPQVAASLGIVYTPVEVVDFIINSVQSILGSAFAASLADEGVHVLDPFTGTGTFIVRMLQSGLIPPAALPHKYEHELHANEIVLLAYYIAAINIEAAYHDVVSHAYQPFQGIVLTDTFQMYEHGDTLDERLFPQNNERARRQKTTDIRVIIGNPPYSVGQGSQNDNNQNIRYKSLDGKIEDTYAAKSSAGLKRNLYDSYIRAFRYASDRVKDRGVVCFVSNGSFIDSGSADGFRKSLAEDFSAIYCFNLRGNQRTSGETSRQEGGKIFGQGSRTPIAITMLVKDSGATGPCRLHYHDIGDYLSRDQKLRMIRDLGDASEVPWQVIIPDESGDWINLRNDLFESFAPLGDKKGKHMDAMFDTYSLGVATNRDAWAYNFGRSAVGANMKRMIEVFNEQVTRFDTWAQEQGQQRTAEAVDRFIDRDDRRISWTVNLKEDVRKRKLARFDAGRIVTSMYRPFCKQALYFDRQMNERVLQIPKLFPTPEHRNRVVAVSGVGSGAGYSVLMTDVIPCLTMAGAGNAVQCFPLYRFEQSGHEGLFSAGADASGYVRLDAISARSLARYQERYGVDVTRGDIFNYVYGMLHSPEYVSRFASDLGKMIPRIPMVEDFAGFSTAGRDLAKWHLGYETVDPWPLNGVPAAVNTTEMRVTKMRFGKSNGKDDKTSIVFNNHVTLSNIPLEAYDYEVNGKSAIEWTMDRYQVKTDKDSGIVNDPNMWSEDPRYIVDLVARIVRVSMETVEIVESLPALGI